MTRARQNANVSPAVGRNMIINGAMNVAQRSASVTGLGATSGYFTADRWRSIFSSTAGRLTETQTADGPNGISANCLKVDCTTADTSIAAGEFFIIQQKFEGQNLQRIGKGVAGAKQITVSFYVKASASFTFGTELFDSDNGRQITKLYDTTTDWVRHEITFPADVDDGSSPFADDNATSLEINFWLHAGTTYSGGTLNTAAFVNETAANRAAGIDSFFSNTANNFFLTGVQMEIGPVATEFEQEDITTTLAKCQRYYFLLASGINKSIPTGSYYATGLVTTPVQFPVTMRGTPSLDHTTGTNYYGIYANGALDTFNNFTGIGRPHENGITIDTSGVGADGTAGHSGAGITNNSSSYLAFDAEL